jgi:hypothetical protein
MCRGEPSSGGEAETYARQLLECVSATGDFEVDLVTGLGTTPGAPFAKRVLRLSLPDPEPPSELALGRLWARESLIQARRHVGHYTESLLLGGWSLADHDGLRVRRWCDSVAEVYCEPGVSEVCLQGSAPTSCEAVLWWGVREVFRGRLGGAFRVSVELPDPGQGILRMACQRESKPDDPQTPCLAVEGVFLRIDGRVAELPLERDFERFLRATSPEMWIASLMDTAQRRPIELEEVFGNLGDLRSPLERFLLEHSRDYELALIHGGADATPAAVRRVKECGVPVVLLPDFDMRDRRHHRRAVYNALRAADRVLVFSDVVKRAALDRLGARALPVPRTAAQMNEALLEAIPRA